MTLTRSQSALLDAENQVKNLTTELQKAQEYILVILKEQEECSEDYRNLLNQNASLKTALAETEKQLLDTISERNTDREVIGQRLEDLNEYEEALKIIRMHENNAALFEELQKTLQTQADQKLKDLNDQIDCLKKQIITLQSENIEFRNTTHNINMKMATKKTNNPLMNSTQKKDISSKKIRENTSKTKANDRARTTNTRNKTNDKGKLNKPDTKKQPICIDLTTENDQISIKNKECGKQKLTEMNKPQNAGATGRSNEPSNNPELQKKLRKMIILCDIYGKTLAQSIKSNNTEYESVFSLCKPRASLREIVKSISTLSDSLSEGDDMIVIASDVYQYKIENVKYVRDLCNSKKLKFQISTIPYLKPIAKNGKINADIFEMNVQLYNLANHSTGMSIIDINSFKKNYFKCKNTISSDLIDYISHKIIQNSIHEYTYNYNNLIILMNSDPKVCYTNNDLVMTHDADVTAPNCNVMNSGSKNFLVKPVLQRTKT